MQVTCNKCGWVHHALSKAEVGMAILENYWWRMEQSDETLASYSNGGVVDKDSFDRCFNCGPGATFRPSKDIKLIQTCLYEPINPTTMDKE